jgi:hypothetical protein
MIHFVTVSTQDNCMRDYLSLWGKALQPRVAIVYYEDLITQAAVTPGTYILAALDQLDAHSLALVTEWVRALSGRPEFIFVNDPARTLRRGALLEALHTAGLNDFRAIPATGDIDSLTLPVFLRAEHRHEGPVTPLLRTRWEVNGGLVLASRRLGSLDDGLAVEFCATQDRTGVFRKYAAFFVGDRVVPRSLFHGRHWMLKHAASDFSMERSMEELEYVTTNPHEEQLSQIRALAHVGYGRIDYAIKDGRVQTWEINLKPTIGRGALRQRSGIVPRELEGIRREVKDTFYGRFSAALEALDTVATDQAQRPVTLGPARPRLPPISIPMRIRLPWLRQQLRPVWPQVLAGIRTVQHIRDRIAVSLLAPVGYARRRQSPRRSVR